MGINEQLNKLFNKMIEEHPEFERNFKKDGIINETEFNIQKSKGNAVLFIAKEPNNLSKEKETGDFRKWWNAGKLEYGFSYRIGEWAYGIKSNFPDYREAESDRTDAIKSIAFMNLKKSGGGGSTIFKDYFPVVSKLKNEIIRQIEIIKPDIIVGCGLYESVWREIFNIGSGAWVESGYEKNITRWNDIKVIKFYHPSNRFPRTMNYSLLGRIYQSNAFNNL